MRLNKSAEKSEEKAFQAKTDRVTARFTERLLGRGRGRGSYGGRIGDKGRGRSIEKRQINHDQRSYKSNIQCYDCRKYGHTKADCWYKDKIVNVAESNAESNLFMAKNGSEEGTDQQWFIDSGCSNHMTGKEEFFSELDESKRQ